LRNTASAASNAIQITRQRGLTEIGSDELLLGCLQALSRFGIAQFGPWTFDLEVLGIDWLKPPARTGESAKIAYSDETVIIFDRAAHIARLDGYFDIRMEHLLVAFTNEETGLMRDLRRTYSVDSAGWRAAAAALPGTPAAPDPPVPAALPAAREYLTPEEAAEALGIHVQTLRAYVRSGKLPALRVAGERSLRIRRCDLEKVLEPLVPEKS
jgi:excisionase family DNA binding protein